MSLYESQHTTREAGGITTNVIIVIAILLTIGGLLWFGLTRGANESENTQNDTIQTTTSDSSSESTEDTNRGTNDEHRVINVELYQYGYDPDPLVLIAGETVLLRFSTRDVAHSFSMFDEGFEELNVYVAEGEPVEVEFTVPDKPGDYATACNVFCGSGHSDMVGTVRVEVP